MSDEQPEQDQKPMEFTAPEKRFLEAMWAGFKTIPELDMQKIGAKMDMNPRSCANLWGQIKKKIMHNANCPVGPSGGDGTDNQSPGTPAKRKRGKKDDDGSPATKTPRTPRGRPKKAADAEGTPASASNKRKGKAAKQEEDFVKEETVEADDAEDNQETGTKDVEAEVAQPGDV